MDIDETKQHELDRTELLFDEERILNLLEDYHCATEIKRHVKTTAKVYEIRTAIQYWIAGSPDWRSCRATWTRLEMVDSGEVDAEEAMQL